MRDDRALKTESGASERHARLFGSTADMINEAASRNLHPPVILVTVDLEDWFQVENLRSVYPCGLWESCKLRIDLYTKVLLDFFDHYQVQATFFVLGWVAERCNELVTEIAYRGHEIASHGYSHRRTYELTETELREEAAQSKKILEDITGKAVSGYRAPCFSMSPGLTGLLMDEGYVYDSSYNDVAVNANYGRLGDQWTTENGYRVAANGLIELPISNLKIRGITLPWGGGGYFRFWPSSLFRWGVKRIVRTEGKYLFYFHPWELNSVQPRAGNVGTIKSLRHHLNLRDTFHRLNAFLATFRECRFLSCLGYLEQQGYDDAAALV